MQRIGIILLCVYVGVTLGGYCPEGEPAHPQDVRARGEEVSIFSDLTVEEMDGVLDYMYNRSGLRIASWSRGTLNDSYIYVIEALPPRKRDALRYLDQNGPKPTRNAKVILYRGDANPPDIQELKVGPLPRPTSYEVIKNPKYKDPIPFHNRNPIADHEAKEITAYMYQQMARISHILKAGTGGYTFSEDCGDKCLAWFPNVPGRWKSGEHTLFAQFFKDLDTSYLHPIGLQVRVDISSLIVSEWTIDFIWFRGESFRSIDAFLDAVKASDITVEPILDPENAHERTLYSSLNFRGDPLPKKPRRGPRSYYPDGRRYEIEGHHVSWQGWDFNFGVKTVQGMHVDDIQFHGERIVYELALQELGAFYSGDTPASMHTSYFDTIVFIGREIYQLQPGIDCPEHATFFDFVHYLEGKAFVLENSVCVFEHDMGIPLRRHYESDHMGGYKYVQGMQDNVLILRSMVVAYNYEYINDIIFHQQGGIETKLTLSGYILPAFNTPDTDHSRGVEVFPNGQGSIHHHLIHFKADLDIKGTSNRFETYDIHHKKFDDVVDVVEHIYGNYFQRNLRLREGNAQFTPDPNQHLIFYNDEHENQYKNKQGYRLQVVHGSKILYPDDWRMAKGGALFRNPVSVTVHHDDEQVSSLTYASMDPFDPVMSFLDFITDNESIVDEDLVTWVSLGTIHIPHTEDIPIVTTQNTQLVFHLTPYNYFPEDPSLASRDNIRVERTGNTAHGDASHESTYSYQTLLAGVPADLTCVPDNVKLPKEPENGAGKIEVSCILMLFALIGLVM